MTRTVEAIATGSANFLVVRLDVLGSYTTTQRYYHYYYNNYYTTCAYNTKGLKQRDDNKKQDWQEAWLEVESGTRLTYKHRVVTLDYEDNR